MNHDRILDLNEAANLVRAAPDTLLKYIHRGELPAARLGKSMVVVDDDLVAFVKAIAAQQSAARAKDAAASGQTKARQAAGKLQPKTLACILTPADTAASCGRRGRRKLPPPLPGDSV